jgi:hypothetical protein
MSTVKEQLNVANPNDLADLIRLAKAGFGFSQCVPRSQRLTVAANLAVPAVPARQILRCFASVGGTMGDKTPVGPETVPAATQCAISPLGQIEFAAADAVTQCDVDYLPVEGELIEDEVIQVTAGGLGTFVNSKSCKQIVSAALVAPAGTPGAKVVVARGTLVGALAPGQCAVQFNGTTIQFVAAEAGVACTAIVSYYAMPSVGTARDGFGDLLDAAFTS